MALSFFLSRKGRGQGSLLFFLEKRKAKGKLTPPLYQRKPEGATLSSSPEFEGRGQGSLLLSLEEERSLEGKGRGHLLQKAGLVPFVSDLKKRKAQGKALSALSFLFSLSLSLEDERQSESKTPLYI